MNEIDHAIQQVKDMVDKNVERYYSSASLSNASGCGRIW
jgi:hypothetical protein